MTPHHQRSSMHRNNTVSVSNIFICLCIEIMQNSNARNCFRTVIQAQFFAGVAIAIRIYKLQFFVRPLATQVQYSSSLLNTYTEFAVISFSTKLIIIYAPYTCKSFSLVRSTVCNFHFNHSSCGISNFFLKEKTNTNTSGVFNRAKNDLKIKEITPSWLSNYQCIMALTAEKFEIN